MNDSIYDNRRTKQGMFFSNWDFFYHIAFYCIAKMCGLVRDISFL